MKLNNLSLFITTLIVSCSVFSSVKSEKDKIMEELTGQPVSKKNSIYAAKSTSKASQYLQSGLVAAKKKDYILALKYFNTIILKHPKSTEIKAAYLAKAQLYTEMGLPEQSNLNSRMASKYGNKIVK